VTPIRWLLATCSAPPCGAGDCPAWLAATYHLANLLITACYLAIPGIVLWYWRYRRDGISPLYLWMVLAFLPAQAMSRLSRIDGVPFPVIVALDVLAAVVTVNSVVWLRPKILHLLKLPSRQQLHDLNAALQVEVLKVHTMHLDERQKNAKLLAEVEKLRFSVTDPSERSWIQAKHKALDRIVAVIKEG
jgi:hypothetical protein